MLVWDELIYLIAQRRIFSDTEDFEKMKRYIEISEKCAQDQERGCTGFCEEFNFNIISYVFDGEQKVF